DVSLPPTDSAERLHQACPEERVLARPGCGGKGVETPSRLRQVAALLPEAPHGKGEPDRCRGVTSGRGPVQRGPDVVVLQLDLVEEAALVGAGELGRDPFGHV